MMKFQTKSTSPEKLPGDCLVVPVLKSNRFTEAAARVNDASDGKLRKLAKMSAFKGEAGATRLFHDVPGIRAARLMLIGVGNKSEIDARRIREAIAAVMQRLQQENCSTAVITLPFEETAADLHYGLLRETAITADSANYRFNSCKSEASEEMLVKKVTLCAAPGMAQLADKAVAHGRAVAAGMRLARDLANLPGNICTPGYLADEARQLAQRHGKLSCSILDEKAMLKLGMGALLSVSRGSRQPAKLIVMEHKGGSKGQKPVVLVGKGVDLRRRRHLD